MEGHETVSHDGEVKEQEWEGQVDGKRYDHEHEGRKSHEDHEGLLAMRGVQEENASLGDNKTLTVSYLKARYRKNEASILLSCKPHRFDDAINSHSQPK